MKNTVIILVHGIRTYAEWQEKIPIWLEIGDSIVTKPLRYGRFDLLRFLSPFGSRKKPVERLTVEIEDVLAKYPEGSWRRVIVAHSFGTYAVTKILESKPSMYIDDLLLCGSIVPDRYNWIQISKQIRGSIINDCSRNDIWPVFAKSVTWGYGATGTYGIGAGAVDNRFHNVGHSDYFSSGFVRKFWKPFIESSEIIPASIVETSASSPWYFQIFGIPLRWVIVVVFLMITAPILAQHAFIEDTLHRIYVSAYESVIGPYISKKSRIVHAEANKLYHNNGDQEAAYKKYQVSASMGNPNSGAAVAKLTANGWGTLKDKNAANKIALPLIESLEKLSTTEPESAYQLGYLYSNGIGVQSDAVRSRALSEFAAQNGHHGAMYNLAFESYWKLIDPTEEETVTAYNYAKSSADAGHISSNVLLAQMYIDGWGVQKNIEKAVAHYLQYALRHDHARGIRVLGDAYSMEGTSIFNPSTAADYYEKSAELGDVIARRKLGTVYLNGLGRDKNEEVAAKHYELAAKQDDSIALYLLGWLYYSSWSTLANKNYLQAVEYLKRADELSPAGAAAALLGEIYLGGTAAPEVPVDFESAFGYYSKCAPTLGDCLEGLAEIYERGLVGKPDRKKAEEYYRRAVDKQSGYAAYRLANLLEQRAYETKNIGAGQESLRYLEVARELRPDDPHVPFELARLWREGLPGVESNQKKATGYFLKAAELGEERAYSDLGWRLITRIGTVGLKLETSERILAGKRWLIEGAKTGSRMALANLSALSKYSGQNIDQIRHDMSNSKNLEDREIWQVALEFGEFSDSDILKLRDEGLSYIEKNFARTPCRMNQLAKRYYEGDWAPKNFELAERMFTIASEGGSSAAKFNLGRMHLRQEVRSPNYESGFKLLNEAVELGFGKAATYLGKIYIDGLHGINPDNKRAILYFYKAGSLGEDIDTDRLKKSEKTPNILLDISNEMDASAAVCSG